MAQNRLNRAHFFVVPRITQVDLSNAGRHQVRSQRQPPRASAAPQGGSISGMTTQSSTTDRPRDPVCGMAVRTDVAVEDGLVAEYDSHTYYFCREGCLQQFRASPAQYITSHHHAETRPRPPQRSTPGCGSGTSRVPAACRMRIPRSRQLWMQSAKRGLNPRSMQASAKSPKATLSAHRQPHPLAVGHELTRAPSLIRSIDGERAEATATWSGARP